MLCFSWCLVMSLELSHIASPAILFLPLQAYEHHKHKPGPVSGGSQGGDYGGPSGNVDEGTLQQHSQAD